jgi:hypothetical protein
MIFTVVPRPPLPVLREYPGAGLNRLLPVWQVHPKNLTWGSKFALLYSFTLIPIEPSLTREQRASIRIHHLYLRQTCHDIAVARDVPECQVRIACRNQMNDDLEEDWDYVDQDLRQEYKGTVSCAQMKMRTLIQF